MRANKKLTEEKIMNHKCKLKIKQFLKTFIPLLFGLLILWLIFYNMDFKEISKALRNDVNYWIIALSLPFALIANTIRAYRWHLLIQPLGYNPKKSNLIYAVWGNYGVNLGIPRFGEIWRCTMINRYEKIPFTKLVGTLITDRLSDLFSVAIIVIIAFILNVPYFETFFEQHPDIFDKFKIIFSSVWTYAIIILIICAVGLCFVLFKEYPFIKKIKKTISDIWEGIRSILYMDKKERFIIYTLLIWICYFLYFYICFYAFPFTKDLGLNCGLIAFGMSSIAVAVPIPAGIGPWHFMVITALIGFGVSDTNAAAFALCTHTIQSILFTALFGMFGVVALPIANKGK